MKKFIMSLFLVSLLTTTLNSFAETPYEEMRLEYGKWALSWFADDFGDPQYDQPYLITELTAPQGQHAERYFEICFGEISVGPAFIINIGTRGVGGTQRITMYGDCVIKIKSSNGSVYSIPASTYNGAIILTEDKLLDFADLIDKGNYHLALTFHSYLDTGNNPVTWSYNCSNETKDVKKAVLKVFQ